jgi:hypothetical protein
MSGFSARAGYPIDDLSVAETLLLHVETVEPGLVPEPEVRAVQAGKSVRELRVQRGTRTIELLVVL